MLQITGIKPLPGVLYGITHDQDGSVLIREPRVLKVGIGLPKGKAINCWIHNDGKFKVRIGYKQDEAKSWVFDTAREAAKFYRENLAKAPVCPFPRKIGFFTFTRPVLQEDGTEVFEPDFQALEAHGPTPTEIDVVFLDDNPFSGAYQMWSATELKCKGDGINALRVLSMAAHDTEKALAAESKAAGEKYFPIVEGCWTKGCQYANEFTDGRGKVQPSPCKPGGDLKFQLAKNIRVGGTAFFHTSGYRSISHIFSSIERIKILTGGRLAGIPLKMILRPYKTKHNGQTATQYGVSLEFRAEDIESLRKNLMEQAWKFRSAALIDQPERRVLPASEEPIIEGDDDDPPVLSAQAMADEFYDGGEEDPSESAEDAPVESAPVHSAAAATEAKTTTLAEKLQAKSSSRKHAGESYAPPPAPTTPSPAPDPAAAPKEGDLF